MHGIWCSVYVCGVYIILKYYIVIRERINNKRGRVFNVHSPRTSVCIPATRVTIYRHCTAEDATNMRRSFRKITFYGLAARKERTRVRKFSPPRK